MPSLIAIISRGDTKVQESASHESINQISSSLKGSILFVGSQNHYDQI
jgi:hypothetical protein